MATGIGATGDEYGTIRAVAPRLPVRTGLVTTLALVVLVALFEIDRLSGELLDEGGRTWSFTRLMGPAVLLDRSSAGWTAQFGEGAGRLYGWLAQYVLLDLVFVGCYAWLLRRAGTPRWVVAALAATDVVEDAAALLVRGPLPALAPLAVGASVVKWLAVGAVVGWWVLHLRGSGGEARRRALARAVRALYLHRFSVIAIVVLAVLSVLPGPELLDQLPDVQRAWRLGDDGAWHAGFAVLSLLLLALVVFVLGRLRSDLAVNRVTALEEPPLADLTVWLAPPAATLALGLLLAVSGVDGVNWGRLAIFVTVPLAIAGASWLLRIRGALSPPPTRVRRDQLPATTTVGDLLTVSVVVIGGLGLVRSFTPLMLLSGTAADDAGSVAAVIALLGAEVALGIWPVAPALADRLLRLADDESQVGRMAGCLTPGAEGTFPRWLGWVTLAGGAGVFVGLGLFPSGVGERLGVIAVTELALTALVLIVGSTVFLAQGGRAPEVFWPVRLTAAPVASMLALAVLWASSVGEQGQIHGLRTLPSAAGGTRAVAADSGSAAQRWDVNTAFQQWLVSTEDCGVVRDGMRLRPMLLVAAEGGGIRAAYWTAASLDVIAGRSIASGQWSAPVDPDCAARSTLFSAGSSGGAVGLSVSRFSQPGSAHEQVAAMAGPEPLASGAVGLFLRDLGYAAGGLPLPDLSGGDAAAEASGTNPRTPGWVDRAGLFEAGWQAGTQALRQPFLPATPRVPTEPTGHVVLASTAVGSGCRMFVSQLALGPGVTSAVSPDLADVSQEEDPARRVLPDCASREQPAPGSTDLLADYRPPSLPADASQLDSAASDGAAASGCIGPLSAATAAMLSSRVPYVTPSGVIGPCRTEPAMPVQQLVDGGYVENSGLGTLIDLAPRWAQAVRAHNTAQLATAETPDLVVPVVVYLDNGSGSDLAGPGASPTSELLVPLVTLARAGTAQNDAQSLLQRVAALVEPSSLWSSDAATQERRERAEAAVAGWRSHPAYVVHQSTEPSLTVPLGWVLSSDSLATMDAALSARSQPAARCGSGEHAATSRDVLCRRGFGSLADLLDTLTG